MPTLLLRLAGPLQSWGTTSRFDERETQLEPSKSGVIGLLCAALGRDRSDAIDDLAALRMGIRVDREGVLMRDFQTATGVLIASGSVKHDRTVVSPRYFLADAVFLVGLEGPDLVSLRTLKTALRSPRWPLALGRKAFPPSQPVWIDGPPCDGLHADTLEAALREQPRLAPARDDSLAARTLIETAAIGSMRMDQPLAPFAARRFGPRYVLPGVLDDLPLAPDVEPRASARAS